MYVMEFHSNVEPLECIHTHTYMIRDPYCRNLIYVVHFLVIVNVLIFSLFILVIPTVGQQMRRKNGKKIFNVQTRFFS